MSQYIPESLRHQIAKRAGHRCEYCLIREEDSFLGFQVDHIISLKHEGQTEPENLAWSCFACNNNKGSDIGTVLLPGKQFTARVALQTLTSRLWFIYSFRTRWASGGVADDRECVQFSGGAGVSASFTAKALRRRESGRDSCRSGQKVVCKSDDAAHLVGETGAGLKTSDNSVANIEV
jgi:hypothetical protein